MNLSKQDFRKQYSEYRKNLSSSYYKGRESFMTALRSNDIFSEICTKIEKPVSISIYLYKRNLQDKKLLKTF